jgi:putative hydrolase of the HAD superfamily
MGAKKISTLIFDFGGVIIDIDFERTINAFVKLGAENFGENYSKATQSGIFDALDKGDVSETEFVNSLKPLLPAGVSDQQIIDAWNAIIIGIPEGRVRLLEEVRKHYQICLLSNTNITHYNLYTPFLKEFGYNSLHELFHKVFLSFELGMRKPDRDIFDYLFVKSEINKQESLFIDDSHHIIEAARSYGIPAFWLRDGMDIRNLFEEGRLKPGVIQEAYS